MPGIGKRDMPGLVAGRQMNPSGGNPGDRIEHLDVQRRGDRDIGKAVVHGDAVGDISKPPSRILQGEIILHRRAGRRIVCGKSGVILPPDPLVYHQRPACDKGVRRGGPRHHRIGNASGNSQQSKEHNGKPHPQRYGTPKPPPFGSLPAHRWSPAANLTASSARTVLPGIG